MLQTHEAAGIDLHAPHATLRIDGRAVRTARQPAGECREVAARAHIAGRRVVVIGEDCLLEAVGEIEALPVRAPARAVRADDAAVQRVHGEIGIEAEELADRLLSA